MADGLEVVESCGWWPHHWMSLPAKAPPLSAAVTCVCSHLQRCEHKQRVNAVDQRCSLFCLPLTLTHREELAVFLLPPHYKPGRTIMVEKSIWTPNYCHLSDFCCCCFKWFGCIWGTQHNNKWKIRKLNSSISCTLNVLQERTKSASCWTTKFWNKLHLESYHWFLAHYSTSQMHKVSKNFVPSVCKRKLKY